MLIRKLNNKDDEELCKDIQNVIFVAKSNDKYKDYAAHIMGALSKVLTGSKQVIINYY